MKEECTKKKLKSDLWKVNVNWVINSLFDKFLKNTFVKRWIVCPFFNVLIYEFID